MNWLQASTKTIKGTTKTYYTLADQDDFYDWALSHDIPKDIPFTQSLPQLDPVNPEKVVIAIYAPFYSMSKQSDRFFVQNSDNIIIDLKSGTVDNIADLIEKNQMRHAKMLKDINSFKTALLAKRYIISGKKFPHLLRVKGIQDNSVSIDDFGFIDDIKKATQLHLTVLQKSSSKKTGRAYEMEELKRFETYLLSSTATNNADASKMDFVLESMKAKPVQSKHQDVKDLFIAVYPDKEEQLAKLAKFFSRPYVQTFLSTD